jgi:hypothetical protein
VARGPRRDRPPRPRVRRELGHGRRLGGGDASWGVAPALELVGDLVLQGDDVLDVVDVDLGGDRRDACAAFTFELPGQVVEVGLVVGG